MSSIELVDMDTTEEHRPERQVTQGPLENSVELREIEVFTINGGSKRRHWFSTLNLGVSGYISLISLTVSVIVGIGAGQATNRSNSIGLASYEVSAWALCSDHEAIKDTPQCRQILESGVDNIALDKRQIGSTSLHERSHASGETEPVETSISFSYDQHNPITLTTYCDERETLFLRTITALCLILLVVTYTLPYATAYTAAFDEITTFLDSVDFLIVEDKVYDSIFARVPRREDKVRLSRIITSRDPEKPR
ncbi:uncharacterized protein F4817DRAFT_322807 [Daldinia loculata]|uniref:uncharacterized protein n=1 Tax=Daldinia loculata TaxID=103429 RepID=UPI0020C394C1|nr:uncharacterized protein F4817DRAFT_322807 [Daldinia loculata]KAI1652298.1 hypothetical protein F4817DRAFT_322807 [Daldinia loculata]